MKKLFIAALSALFLIPIAEARADDPIPALISVSPSSGDIDGGNTITITGANFLESTVIKVGGLVVPDTFVNSTQITIVMPSRSAGFVSISAFAGMVGSVLSNAYEYIDIPDPSPSPTPTPSPTESATPEPTPTPTASATPTPSPSFTPVPSAGSVGSSSSYVQEEMPEPTFSSTPQVQTQTEEIRDSSPSPTYDFGNNLVVYANSSIMNVSLSNLNTVRKRFTLQKRIGSSWKTINISYRDSNGELTFYGIPLSNGSYRIVNAGNPIRWFRISDVIL